jgi:zinc protease
LIIQQYPESKIVALQLWVGVGGRDESPGEKGFSHFAEHMLFKGTETLGPGFVDQEVESVGGRTNAATSLDYTYYYMLLPAARAVRGIHVLGDMALNFRLDPTELDREREVVFEEVRLGEDNPRAFLSRRLYQMAFAGHPYGSSVLGSPAALQAATRESLRAFLKRHYVPENMALVVAGPVDIDEIRAAVRQSFGEAPLSGFRRQALPQSGILPAKQRLTVERPEQQAYLGLAWQGPAVGHRDMYAVELLAQLLGGARTSRLHQVLREREKLVSTISAGYGALQGAGVVTVTAQLEAKDLTNAESATLDVIRRIRDQGVSREELDRAVTAVEAERVFARETVEGLALAYGRAETIWSIAADRDHLRHLRSVSAPEVQAVARRYLTDEYVCLVLSPKASGP